MEIGSVGAQTTIQPAVAEPTRPAAQPEAEKAAGEKKPEAPKDTFVRGDAATVNAAKQTSETSSTEAGTTDTGTPDTETSDTASRSVQTLLESTSETTSISKYTQAEIEEYDANGDGEIDASEELSMKLDKMREQAEAARIKTDQDKAITAYKTSMEQAKELGKLIKE